jgi:hypothetical protein
MSTYVWNTPAGCIDKAYQNFKKGSSDSSSSSSDAEIQPIVKETKVNREFEELLETFNKYNIIDEDLIDDICECIDTLQKTSNNKYYTLAHQYLDLIGF